MSAEDRIAEAIGQLRSPSIDPLRGRPMSGYPVGSDEARLDALEADIQTLSKALILAAREIDHVASKIDGG